jgi:preprotein translocase subunit SecG
MATFLSILIIVVCVLLVLVVLIQNPKGGGIASNFMSTNQFIGAKQQVELIEQITWGFVGALVVLCIAFSALVGTGNGPEAKESKISNAEPMPGNAAQHQQQAPPQQQQQAPAQQQQAPPAQAPQPQAK